MDLVQSTLAEKQIDQDFLILFLNVFNKLSKVRNEADFKEPAEGFLPVVVNLHSKPEIFQYTIESYRRF